MLPSTEDPIPTVLTTRPPAPAASPSDAADRVATVVLGAAALLWVGLLLGIVRQPVFLTTDMVSNHVHIWYVAERLWHGHGIPLHMPVLASGDAYAFPYASVPWLVGAVLWPLGGDHVVTVLLVTGAIGVMAATFWALPSLRRGWWAVAVLANPFLLTSVLLGQLPFLWAAAAFMVAIGAWRRDRMVLATTTAALALMIHPAVMLPMSGIAILFALPTERHRGRLLGCWAVAVVVAIPATFYTLASPVVSETSGKLQAISLVTTVLERIPVLAIPVALDVLARHWRPAWPGGRHALPAGMAALSLVVVYLMWQPFNLDLGWSGVTHRDSLAALARFVPSPPLQRGRVYRVLVGGDQKYGLYQFVKRGGVLDSELFPESLRRGGFATEEEYARFLAARRIGAVLVSPTYRAYYHSNEPRRLASLAASQRCLSGITVRRSFADARWQQYDVTRC